MFHIFSSCKDKCFECTIENQTDIAIKELTLPADGECGFDAFIENFPADNYINKNFGDHKEFKASSWTSNGIPFVVRSLIRFNFESIPNHAILEKATLFLYSVDNTNNGPGHSSRSGTNDFLLQRATSNWEEQEVTWNSQPTVSDTNSIFVTGTDFYLKNYEIDVTILIQDILNSSQNYGILMCLVLESEYRRILFASSDHGDKSKHPKLIINFKD